MQARRGASVDPIARGARPFERRPPTPLDLDRLDLAAGAPAGLDSDADPLPPPAATTARAALEDELAAALARPPCIVSFSGGRDSSLLLALATHVARRRGLAEPVPLTWRFPDVPSTDESRWQELVIGHLGLRDWERLDFGEELDVLGELATQMLLAHGLLWPATSHVDVPALERARGGSLIVNQGSRALFDGWHFARVQAVAHGHVRPEPRDALRVAAALAPLPLRRRIGASEVESRFPWLRPQARREQARRAGGRLAHPRRWDRWVETHGRLRVWRVGAQSLDLLARPYDVQVRHPLLSPPVLAVLAREGGAAGFRGRAELMGRLGGELVPEPVEGRRGTLAEYGDAFWGERSRAFARDWDGSGIDHELVDSDRLRQIWSGPPWLHASTLAQAAWLAGARS